jgi:hypothetical protein
VEVRIMMNKPCPFCGFEPEEYYAGGKTWIVCSTPMCPLHYVRILKEEWDKRADDKTNIFPWSRRCQKCGVKTKDGAKVWRCVVNGERIYLCEQCAKQEHIEYIQVESEDIKEQRISFTDSTSRQ